MNLSNIPTYHAGIAQSKAYRVLKQMMAKLLKKHGLTMMSWATLGLVYDAGKPGIRITDLANKLDSTKAFVTGNINVLEAKKLVERSIDSKDTRVRIVKLAPNAGKKVQTIEAQLRDDMRHKLYATIDPAQLKSYVDVLNHIASLNV